MTRLAQKKIEILYLKEFLNLIGENLFSIEESDRESPDFIIRNLSGSLIGVEITEYHDKTRTMGGHTRREVEEAGVKLRRKVRKMVSSNPEIQKIFGFLCFRNFCLPTSRESDDFIEELQRCTVTNRDNIPAKIANFTEYSLLKSYLSSLVLREVECFLTWECNLRTGWIGLDDVSLPELVRKKSSDLTKYEEEQKYNDYWLLVISGGEISQSMGIINEMDLNALPELDGFLLKSKFKKVFVFQYMYDTIFEWNLGKGWFKRSFQRKK